MFNISDWSTVPAVLFSLIVLSVYVYFSQKFNYWTKLGVKQLSPTIFFGNFLPCLLAKKTLDQTLREIYNHGEGEKFVGLYALSTPYLILRDTDLIKDVLIKDFNNFSNKCICGNKEDPLGKTNLFFVENPPWKYIRTKLSPAFTVSSLKKMLNIMTDVCEDLNTHFDGLKIDGTIGKIVEVTELCGKLTTDIIGRIAFNTNFQSLTDENAEFRKYGRAMFASNYKRYLQNLTIFFMPALRPLTKAKFHDEEGSKFFREMFWGIINERLASGVKRYDVIDMLIDLKNKQETDNSDVYKLEGDSLVSQAAAFFSGGFETTSTTMYFILYELALNRNIQMRLRNDLLKELEKTNDKITYELITTNVPYLNMVVEEALRKYPILHEVDRIPDNDYTFKGTNLTIPKGTPVIIPIRSLHMDPKYFPNPETFDPERFSQENKVNITPYTYLPFGNGPRQCIGRRLGLMQVKFGLIQFISKYEITFCKKTQIIKTFDHYSAITHAPDKIYLNFRKLSA